MDIRIRNNVTNFSSNYRNVLELLRKRGHCFILMGEQRMFAVHYEVNYKYFPIRFHSPSVELGQLFERR